MTAAFCPDCGHQLQAVERRGRERPTCTGCGYVHYQNPAVGVAVILRDEAGRVLLGQRATGEYAGLWCIPCGYVEWDEDVRDAARREFEEETGMTVVLRGIAAVHSNFHNRDKQTVGIWFEGAAVGGTLQRVDGELTELAWFPPGEPPDLAFPTDLLVLRQLAGEE